MRAPCAAAQLTALRSMQYSASEGCKCNSSRVNQGAQRTKALRSGGNQQSARNEWARGISHGGSTASRPVLATIKVGFCWGDLRACLEPPPPLADVAYHASCQQRTA